MNPRPLLFSIALLSLVACGGKPAQAPEGNTGITETSSKEDMPPPAKETTDAPAPAAASAAAPAAGGVIKPAALKLTAIKKGKNDKTVELKEDGSVLVDGKPAAKLKGDQVDSSGGTSMVTIGLDGTLVGNGVKSGFKFEGDDLVGEGVKLSVGDDGTISSTASDKTEPLVKIEGAASAKRAALIVAVLYMNVPGNPNAEAPKAPVKEKKTIKKK